MTPEDLTKMPTSEVETIRNLEKVWDLSGATMRVTFWEQKRFLPAGFQIFLSSLPDFFGGSIFFHDHILQMGRGTNHQLYSDRWCSLVSMNFLPFSSPIHSRLEYFGT